MPRKNKNGRKKRKSYKRNSSPFRVANMEQALGDELLAEKELTPLDSLCSIHIHSKRKRLVDADGVSAKAAIDSLVLAGLLQDDSPKFVKEVTYSQEQSAEEETIITICEAKDGQ